MLLEGIFSAVTTPFYPDGRLYARKLEHNVDRYSRTPVAGLVLLGSTGEAPMLDDAETREVLKVAAGATAAEKVLVAGVGRESAAATLRMAEYAAEQRYDALLVRTPNYYAPQMTPLAMLTYYRAVADASPLPVVLYSIPKFTHYQLAAELVAELAEHPNVIGLKDSGGDVAGLAAVVERVRGARKRTMTVTPVFAAATRRMMEPVAGAGHGLIPAEALLANAAAGVGGDSGVAAVAITEQAVAVAEKTVARAAIKTRTREVGFQVLSGVAEKLLPSLEAGATGAVMAFAACAPQACHEVYVAWKENDPALAAEKQARIVEAAEYVVGRLGVAGVKYACDLNGYYGGRTRLPLLPLTGEEKAEVERVMRDLRN